MTIEQPTTTARFQVQRRELAAALSRLVKVAPKRSPKRVLRAVRLSVNGSAELAATDCDIYATETLATAAERTGERETLIDAAEFRATVSALGGDSLTVELVADGAILANNRGARRFIPAAAELAEAPDVNHLEPSAVHGPYISGRWFGSAETLAALFRLTEYATDSTSSRYALGGCLVELAAGNATTAGTFARSVATDGRRLAMATVGTEPQPEPLAESQAEPETVEPAAEPQPLTVSGIIPAAAVRLVIKALANKSARFALVQYVNESPQPVATPSPETASNEPAAEPKPAEPVRAQVFIFDADARALSLFTFRLMDGRYPNWRAVVDTNPEPVAVIDSAELAGLVSATVKVANPEANNACKFRFRPNGARVYALCRNPFSGRLATVATAASVERFALTNLNVASVSQFAAAFGRRASVPVSVAFADAESAALFQAEQAAGGVSVSVVGLIMPLAIKRKKTTPAAEPETAASE